MDGPPQKYLEIERTKDTLVVRFTRPEARNPLSVEVIHRLFEIISDAAAVPALRGLILTGTDDVFASGADLREIAAVTAGSAPAFALRGQQLMRQIEDLPIVTAAAVNGYCFGGALDLALACKYRVAAPSARFAHPGTGLGIITGWGGTQRLPRLVGRTNALEMFFTAEPVDAERALSIGMIDEIDNDPVSRAIAFVESVRDV